VVATLGRHLRGDRETSYIGRLGVESLAAMALVFPFVILTMTMSGGAMGGGVASAIAPRDRRRRHRPRLDAGGARAADRHLPRADVMLGMLIFGPTLLNCSAAAATCWPMRSAMCRSSFGGAVVPLADEYRSRNSARHRQHEAAVAADAVFPPPARSFWAARSASGSGRSRHSACAASPRLAGRLRDQPVGDGLVHVFRRARVVPKIRGLRIQWAMFFDILKVGAVSCFSPLQSVLTSPSSPTCWRNSAPKSWPATASARGSNSC
jgi:hypothetical protein